MLPEEVVRDTRCLGEDGSQAGLRMAREADHFRAGPSSGPGSSASSSLHPPAPSSLLSEKRSKNPVTFILRDEWAWSPRQGCGRPASQSCQLWLSPSSLKWELKPRREGRGMGVLVPPPTHILQLHTYLGDISGPGGTPWGQPDKGSQSRVCVCALERCAHSATLHLSFHPGPRGRKCRLTHSLSSGRGPTSWKALRRLSHPRKPRSYR